MDTWTEKLMFLAFVSFQISQIVWLMTIARNTKKDR